MAQRPSRSRPDTLFLKLGDWFEARATGWGVLAVPTALALILLAALARAFAG